MSFINEAEANVVWELWSAWLAENGVGQVANPTKTRELRCVLGY